MLAPGTVEAFELQASWCHRLRSPLYGGLLERCTEDIAAGGVLAHLLDGWTGKPFPDALPLRLLAAVHDRVLTGDAPALARFAKIGFEPCKPFTLSNLDPAAQAALKDLPKTALDKIGANQSALGKMVDGWQITKGLGVYGTDYMKRAVVAAFGWPANLQEDAVYPYTLIDSTGAKLTGANKYTLTFAKGQTPPVSGFWSITMYMIDQGWWFVPNKLNKFTVSPRNNLKANPDGSITLYFQKDSPGADKESNWLPAPAGEFIPMLRMYWPQEKAPSILDGTWTPPKIQKVN